MGLLDFAKGAAKSIVDNPGVAFGVADALGEVIPTSQNAQQAKKTVFNKSSDILGSNPSEANDKAKRSGMLGKIKALNPFSRSPVEITKAFKFAEPTDSLSIQNLNYYDNYLYLFKAVSKDELYRIEKNGLEASTPFTGQYTKSARSGMVTLVVKLPAFFKGTINVKVGQVTVEGIIPSKFINVVVDGDKENDKQTVKVKVNGQVIGILPVAAYIGKTFIKSKAFKQGERTSNTKLDLIKTLKECKAAIAAYDISKPDPTKKKAFRELLKSVLSAIEYYQEAVTTQTTTAAKEKAIAEREEKRLKDCAFETFLKQNGTQGEVSSSVADAPVTPTMPPAPSAANTPAPDAAPRTTAPASRNTPAEASNSKSAIVPAPADPPKTAQQVPSYKFEAAKALMNGPVDKLEAAVATTPSSIRLPPLASVTNAIQRLKKTVDPSDVKLENVGGKPRRKKANAASAATAPSPRRARKP
jgi:hypothetical protein